MNSKDKIQIRRYNYFDKCFADEGTDPYEIGYLLDLIDDASDWNEVIVEGYTAADVLLSIAHFLDIDSEHYYDEILEATKKAVEQERKALTLNTDELIFALHLTNLQTLDKAIDLLKEADSLEDFEETLRDLLKDLSLAVLASNDLIGNKKSLEITQALLAAHEYILGIE